MTNREIKFRAWDKGEKRMYKPFDLKGYMSYHEGAQDEMAPDDPVLMQYTGLKDKNGVAEIYEGDVMQFNNGDRFVVRMEDWLELYVDFIGDPEIEDQARDLYRIERAEVIGNVWEHPNLIKNNEYS